MLSVSIAAVIIYLTYEYVQYKGKQLAELNEREIMEIKNEIASEKRGGFMVKKEQDFSLSEVKTYNKEKMDDLENAMKDIKAKFEKQDVSKYYKVNTNNKTQNNSKSIGKSK